MYCILVCHVSRTVYLQQKNLGHVMMYIQIYSSVCCLILHVLVISQEFEKCCKLYITLVHKGYRIVCSTVHLHSYNSLYKVNSVMNNTMYLRTASQCVSILHSVTETMTFWYKKDMTKFISSYRSMR